MLFRCLRTRAELRAIVLAVKAAVAANIPVSESHIGEAIARSLGRKTVAALVTALDAGESFTAGSFDRVAFVDRLATLSKDPEMAEAADVALDGITLSIDIVKRSPGRQRHDIWADVAFDIDIRAGGAIAALDQLTFFVPDNFSTRTLDQPLRIASDSAFKLDGAFAVTRNRDKRDLLTAKLVNGRWKGALYVDLPSNDLDGVRYIRSARAALARAIMPALTPWVRCNVYRPDRYDLGAWRVEMSLGPAAREALQLGKLVFDVPTEKGRLFDLDDGFLFDIRENNVFMGQFRNGVWLADLYSNGIAEDENPVPIAAIKAVLLRNVYTVAEFAQ
jgi:hypothetical protein